MRGSGHAPRQDRLDQRALGRDHFGNELLSFLALLGAIVPALGFVWWERKSAKPRMLWRMASVFLLGVLLAPLFIVYSYER